MDERDDSWQRGRRFAQETITRKRVFAGLARHLPLLAEAGIPMMPLKGALLAWTLYPRPEVRPVRDADILVRRRDLGRAAGLLARAGGRVIPSGGARKCVVSFDDRDEPWQLDLHADLWETGFVPLDVEDAFERAQPWRSPYGVEMSRPPREFTLAHCAAHFARNALTAAQAAEAREIGLLAEWVDCPPEEVIGYLSSNGALAATYYALRAAAAHDEGPRASLLADSIPLPRWRRAVLSAVATGPGVPHPRLLWPLLVV